MGLPKRQQKQALRYGIVGAFVFRVLATLFAAYMISVGMGEARRRADICCTCRTSTSSPEAIPPSNAAFPRRVPGSG